MSGRRALGLILLIALAARLAVVLASPDYVPAYDSGDYVRHAESIAAGNGYPDSAFTASQSESAFRPPVYPYVLGAVQWIFGETETAGRLFGVLLGTLTVLLVYLIAVRLWNRRIALWGAGLAAVAPPLVFLTGTLINEPLYLVIELLAVLLALRAREAGGSWRWAALAGVVCGLGVLTRSNATLVVPVIAAGVWVARPRFSREGLAAPVAVILAAALTVVPWAIRNSLTFDRPVSFNAQGGFALAGTYNSTAYSFEGYRATWTLPEVTETFRPVYARRDLDEVELDNELRRQALDYLVDHPRYVIESTYYNGLRMFELEPEYPGLYNANRVALGLTDLEAQLETACFYALILLALAGWLVWRRTPGMSRPPAFIWLVPLVAMVSAFPILGSTRYRTVSYPILVLAAAPALAAAADRIRPPARASVR